MASFLPKKGYSGGKRDYFPFPHSLRICRKCSLRCRSTADPLLAFPGRLGGCPCPRGLRGAAVSERCQLLQPQPPAPPEHSTAQLHSPFLSPASLSSSWIIHLYSLTQKSEENTWATLLNSDVTALLLTDNAFLLRTSKRTVVLDLKNNPEILYFN